MLELAVVVVDVFVELVIKEGGKEVVVDVVVEVVVVLG